MHRLLFISTVIITFVITGLIYAQPEPPSKEGKLRHLTKTLELTPEQKEKVKAVLKSTHEKMENLREKMEEQRDKSIDEMDNIISSEDDQIMKLLNDDQKKKFAEMKKERENRPPMPKGKGMPHKGEPGHDRGPEGRNESEFNN